jgi:hypothetical protein
VSRRARLLHQIFFRGLLLTQLKLFVAVGGLCGPSIEGGGRLFHGPWPILSWAIVCKLWGCLAA